jgi:hypothetical protein
MSFTMDSTKLSRRFLCSIPHWGAASLGTWSFHGCRKSVFWPVLSPVQAIAGSFGAPDRACHETDHSFPSIQAIPLFKLPLSNVDSLDRPDRRADHACPPCKLRTRKAASLDRPDRRAEHTFPLYKLPQARLSHHFLSNSVTNHRSSIPVLLSSKIMRTSSSKAANTFAGALRDWGRFIALVQPR